MVQLIRATAAQEPEPILRIEGLQLEDACGRLLRLDHWTILDGSIHLACGPGFSSGSSFLKLLAGKSKPHRGHLRWSFSTELPWYAENRIAYSFRDDQPTSSSARAGLSVTDSLILAMKQTKGLFAVVSAKQDPRKRRLVSRCLELTDLSHRKDDKVSGLTETELLRLEAAMLLVQEPTVILWELPEAACSGKEQNTVALLLLMMRESCTLILTTPGMTDPNSSIYNVAERVPLGDDYLREK